MSSKRLLYAIRRKFHTCVFFCSATGISLSRMRSYLGGRLSDAAAQEFETIIEAGLRLDYVHPSYITWEEREAVRKGIAVKYRSSRVFCQKHGFDPVFVSNVITGRKKRRDSKVRKLLEVVG